jgi:hypothetical protein
LGISGKTQLSIHPVSVQISQIVTPMGAITTIPAKKLDRRPAKRPRFSGGGVSGSCMGCV